MTTTQHETKLVHFYGKQIPVSATLSVEEIKSTFFPDINAHHITVALKDNNIFFYYIEGEKDNYLLQIIKDRLDPDMDMEKFQKIKEFMQTTTYKYRFANASDCYLCEEVFRMSIEEILVDNEKMDHWWQII